MRSNRKQHRRFLEAPCRRRTTDASTVFATSMFGYLHLSFGRTVGKKFPDSFGKLFHVISIELPLSLSLPVSAALSGFSISHHSASDRKSTRLNSSHLVISYAVFCLKKKKKKHRHSS